MTEKSYSLFNTVLLDNVLLLKNIINTVVNAMKILRT